METPKETPKSESPSVAYVLSLENPLIFCRSSDEKAFAQFESFRLSTMIHRGSIASPNQQPMSVTIKQKERNTKMIDPKR